MSACASLNTVPFFLAFANTACAFIGNLFFSAYVWFLSFIPIATLFSGAELAKFLGRL